MPRISCSVKSCSYNGSGICRASLLSVGGKNARITEATCCETYINKEGLDNLVNAEIGEGVTQDILCEVNTCAYNQSRHCTLEEIEVSCLTEVEYHSETDCISFERR